MSAFSNNNVKGILALCLGSLVFSLQDSAIKSISGAEAVTLAIVFRTLVSIPVLLAMIWWGGGLQQLRDRQWKLLLIRGAILLVAYTTYFMAFPALPLAEAIALYFMVPLLVTLMAGPMLGEHVGWKSWGAVAVGLIGVFVILQPGSALFNPAALLSLVSAATYGFSMILARKYGSETSASVMSFYQNAVYLVGASAIAGLVALLGLKPPGHPSLDFLFRAWAVPSLHDALLMGACGIIAAFGSTLLAQAYKIGEANVVTPFEYTGMIWAGTFGFLFFGEIPRSTTFIGMGLIALAGILALRAATSGRSDVLSDG